MDLQLKDRVVLVTGSSSEIGKAAAVAFGAEGARVGVTYHANRLGAEDTAKNVQDAGGRIITISSDAVDGWSGLGPYATVKAGLHGISRTLAVGSVRMIF